MKVHAFPPFEQKTLEGWGTHLLAECTLSLLEVQRQPGGHGTRGYVVRAAEG
jgi:hypothetical protein